MTSRSIIRPLTSAEIHTLLDWAAREGWNPGLDDARAFETVDSAGFIGCFIGDRLAAGISAIHYGSDFGFIGLYIADPQFRGLGLGRRTWNAGMRHMGKRTIGLDGVPEQQENYRQIGFFPAYETFRWSGRLAVTPPQTCDICMVTPDLLPAIEALDQRCFPAARSAFLTEWVKPPRLALAIVRDGNLEAYGVLRQCCDGYKIGPLFAQTTIDAERLLTAFAAKSGDYPIHLDVPAYQQDFSDRLAALGFMKGFVTTRMYRGPAPILSDRLVFAITTLELG